MHALCAYVRVAIVSGTVILAVAPCGHSQSESNHQGAPRLHRERLATTDLELNGDLKGAPRGATRYISHEDLLTLPQVSYSVTDDSNFKGPTEVSGVLLEEVMKALAVSAKADLAVAVCDDRYHAHYPQHYLASHHPLLVLKINGHPPESWPKSAEGDADMGPYLISHREFTPGAAILSHRDEAQIPWGVIRPEFRDEKSVMGSISPRGPQRDNSAVQSGYRIAQQNCLRCHNMGSYGGDKAQHPWLVLSAWAATSPEHFATYVRNPQSRNPQAQMSGNPAYDVETLKALTAYFATFTNRVQSSPPPALSREKP
jgi:mono/diheme cytochrome c family protein